MKYLWAPWRIKYIRSVKSKGCIMCDLPAAHKDRENYILYRGDKNFVMLNCYPYNPGHLLIAPFRHCSNLEEFTKEERVEHYEIVARCIKVLKKELTPAGFNMGANLGRVAGAGVEDHFHTHIVPRWNGDTNFVSVLGDVRVVPQSLADAYDALYGKF